jgi:hypothetical protein
MQMRIIALAFALALAGLRARDAGAQPVTQKMEDALARVEAGLSETEQRRVVTGTFDPDAALHAYAQTAYDTYNSVVNALKASPNQVTLAHLKEFEEKVRNHQQRAQKVQERVANIHVRIRNGDISIADEALKNLHPDDVNDLKQWMKPDVRERYRSKDPRFGENLDESRLQKQQLAGRAAGRAKALCQLPDFRRDDGLLTKLSDLLVPRAEASVAFGCYNMCSSATPDQCLACLGKIGPLALKAWTDYQSAITRCGTCAWYNPLCGLCRHVVLQYFLAVLA